MTEQDTGHTPEQPTPTPVTASAAAPTTAPSAATTAAPPIAPAPVADAPPLAGRPHAPTVPGRPEASIVPEPPVPAESFERPAQSEPPVPAEPIEQPPQPEPSAAAEPSERPELPVPAMRPVQPEPPVQPEQPVLTESPSLPESLVPPARGPRRLRAVVRWTAAVAVFAVVGAATAYGVTQVERTDVPGLATVSDGRWDYPEIVRPPLPAGSPEPFADSNKATAHFADLRRLVLPAPRGATADKALAGGHGWVRPKVFLAEYASKDDRETLAGVLTDRGLRHIAARGWTMPDGTRTRIYLLQFDTGLIAGEVQQDEFSGYDVTTNHLRGAPRTQLDEKFPERAQVPNVLYYPYVEARPYGAEHVRQAYIVAGDVVGLVVQSRRGGAKEVPFQQTVVLQEQLLG
ncbi:hypothetical protein ACWEN3_03235 [Streptomyces sp. NPDC004561]